MPNLIDREIFDVHIEPMARERIIQADWDAEAGVWVATSEDVPGLVTEAKTFDGLLKKLRTLVPDLLELNGA